MIPIILAVETATDACSVALSTSKTTFVEYIVEPQAHSKLLLGMVDSVFKQANIKLQDVQAFAFGKGPGSFTGLRIAASVIQGLAFGTDKPVIAISSLQALAQQAYNLRGAKQILATLDARMQEIYWGTYIINPAGLAQSEMADCLENPANLSLKHLATYVAVGTSCIATPPIMYPRAEEVVQLAIAKFLNGNNDNLLTASQAIPTYIRNNVAQKSKKNPD